MVNKLRELSLREKPCEIPGLTPREVYQHLEGFESELKVEYIFKLLSKRSLYSVTTEESLLALLIRDYSRYYKPSREITEEDSYKHMISLGNRLKNEGYLRIGSTIISGINSIMRQEIKNSKPNKFCVYTSPAVRESLRTRLEKAVYEDSVRDDIACSYNRAYNEYGKNPEKFNKLQREYEARKRRYDEGFSRRITESSEDFLRRIIESSRQNNDSLIPYESKLQVKTPLPGEEGWESLRFMRRIPLKKMPSQIKKEAEGKLDIPKLVEILQKEQLEDYNEQCRYSVYYGNRKEYCNTWEYINNWFIRALRGEDLDIDFIRDKKENRDGYPRRSIRNKLIEFYELKEKYDALVKPRVDKLISEGKLATARRILLNKPYYLERCENEKNQD